MFCPQHRITTLPPVSKRPKINRSMRFLIAVHRRVVSNGNIISALISVTSTRWATAKPALDASYRSSTETL